MTLMNLDDFLTQRGRGSRKWLAEEIGRSPQLVSDLCNGRFTVPTTAKLIENATDGKVSWLTLVSPETAAIFKEDISSAEQ